MGLAPRTVVIVRKALPVALLIGVMASSCSAPRATHVLGLLTATQRWETGVVQEPNVWRSDGHWNMIYTGGWDSPALGYATANSAEGPWTKHGVVLGHSHGGWSGVAAHASTLIDRGHLYVYFASPVDGADLHVAVGPDAEHLRTLRAPALQRTGDELGIVNTSVIRTGSRYRMLFESNVAGPEHWRTGYAEGTSPTDFNARVFPLPSLQHGAGAFGGPWIGRTGDGFTVLYHAGRNGTLPTDIYRATSPDLIRWTRGPMVVEHPPGSDQAADPFVVDGWLFYDVMDNTKPSGAILSMVMRPDAG